MDKCSGDVTVQSRKQKKFPLYELEIKLKWEGQLWDEQVRQPCSLHSSKDVLPITRSGTLLACAARAGCQRSLARTHALVASSVARRRSRTRGRAR